MKKTIAILFAALAALAAFGQDIALPAPKDKLGLDLADALKARATSRAFVARDVPLADIATILWAGNGLRGPDAVSSASKAGRTIAYSGDVAYINLYLITPKGAYLYMPDKALLKQVATKDPRAAITPEFIKTSPFMVLFAADLAKAPAFLKGNPVMLMQMMHSTAGFAAENIALASSSLKLGSITMYNIKPADTQGLLQMGKEETPLFVMQLGYTQ
jgi:hypothetical protein